MVSRLAVPVVRAGTRIRRFKGSMFVAGPENSLELNESAEFVFRRIDGGNSVARLAELLAAHYGIELRDAAEDVGDLVDQLAEYEIVDLSTPPVPDGQPAR